MYYTRKNIFTSLKTEDFPHKHSFYHDQFACQYFTVTMRFIPTCIMGCSDGW